MKFELCNTFQEFLNDSMGKGCNISRMLLASRTSDDFLKNKGEQEISYVCISEDNPLFLSFVDQSKYDKIMDECPDKLWTGGASSLRYHSKPSKAIRRILDCDGLYDSDFETFSNMLKSANASESSDWRFTKVGTDKIDKYYLGDNYGKCASGSNLGNSCMRNHECVNEDYFQIYKDEADVKMLVLLKLDQFGEEKVFGRALLWSGVDMTFKDGATTSINFMDRIYSASKEVDEQFFIDYAIAKGYWRKAVQSYGNKQEVVSPVNGREHNVELSFQLYANMLSDIHCFPYLDTFTYGSDGDDVIKNKMEESITCTSHIFESTGGGYENSSTDFCQYTHKYYENTTQTYEGNQVAEGKSVGIYMESDNGNSRQSFAWEDDEKIVLSNHAWGRTRHVLKHECFHHDTYGWVPNCLLVTCSGGEKEIKTKAKMCGIDGGYILASTSAYITSLDVWVHQDRVKEALESTTQAQ
tara:strand:- start:1302 stop:2708 length:1407 start_codon:yes stop_codon:yes gene_type:complete